MIAHYIDHVAVKADVTEEMIYQLCAEAKQYGFYSVSVMPVWIPLCCKLLADSNVVVGVSVGFPLGATWPVVKAQEAFYAVTQGATEVDMVMNIGALKSGKNQEVLVDIQLVRLAVPTAVLKVIIETGLLTEEEKVRACNLVREAGADFVKTCTGFAPGSATVEDIILMRRTVGEQMGIKASGGIRAYTDAIKMIETGATRIGTSSAVKIMQEDPDWQKLDKGGDQCCRK